jgi:hypothetical protein
VQEMLVSLALALGLAAAHSRASSS